MTNWDFIRKIRFATDSNKNDDPVLPDMIRDVLTCDYEVFSKCPKSVFVFAYKRNMMETLDLMTAISV